MQFTVPKFIEHEAKIVGPLTFKQCIPFGIAAAICFFLYFSLPRLLFWPVAITIAGGAFAFAFIKVGGRSLPEVIKNFLVFSVSPKKYRWKRGIYLPKLIRKVKPKEKEEEITPPRIGGESRLQKLFTEIETKTK